MQRISLQSSSGKAMERHWVGTYTIGTFSVQNVVIRAPWGPFFESPGNFSGPKSNIPIEIQRIRAGVLASKLLHCVSLTDSFIMLNAKLLKPRSESGCVTAVQFILFNFSNYSPSIAMELEVSKENTYK